MIETVENGLRIHAPMVIAKAREQLATGIKEMAGLRPGPAYIDLANVGEVDSSALGVLFAWMRRGTAREVNFQLVNAPASLISLAKLYGVSELLPLA